MTVSAKLLNRDRVKPARRNHAPGCRSRSSCRRRCGLHAAPHVIGGRVGVGDLRCAAEHDVDHPLSVAVEKFLYGPITTSRSGAP